MACADKDIAGLVNMCDASKGGISDVWIAVYTDSFEAKPATGETADPEVISTITGVKGGKWHKYYIKKNVASFTSTQTVDPANGVNYVQTELSLVFSKMETKKRIEMTALALNDLAVIVKDANGKYWLLGKDNACYVSAGSGETGTAATDGNRYNLTITDISDTYPFEIDPEQIPTILGEQF